MIATETSKPVNVNHHDQKLECREM